VHLGAEHWETLSGRTVDDVVDVLAASSGLARQGRA
jgi:hypothetical protein